MPVVLKLEWEIAASVAAVVDVSSAEAGVGVAAAVAVADDVSSAEAGVGVSKAVAAVDDVSTAEAGVGVVVAITAVVADDVRSADALLKLECRTGSF